MTPAELASLRAAGYAPEALPDLHRQGREEAERVRVALLEHLPAVECPPVFDAGSAIGAHAGPGAVVLALMPKLPPSPR